MCCDGKVEDFMKVVDFYSSAVLSKRCKVVQDKLSRMLLLSRKESAFGAGR